VDRGGRWSVTSDFMNKGAAPARFVRMNPEGGGIVSGGGLMRELERRNVEGRQDGRWNTDVEGMSVVRVFDDNPHFFASIVTLQPGAKKPPQRSDMGTMTFHVNRGEEDKVVFRMRKAGGGWDTDLLKKGDTCMVPNHGIFAIENTSEQQVAKFGVQAFKELGVPPAFASRSSPGRGGSPPPPLRPLEDAPDAGDDDDDDDDDRGAPAVRDRCGDRRGTGRAE